MPGSEHTVEERLEKARLLPRITPDMLNMCKSVDQLLHAQHVSNLAQAVVCVQEIARDNWAVVIALKWVVLLVDMLEAETPDVRLAACNALAAVTVAQEGRDAVRSAGGLRPLVMLLAEGCRSATAAAAASAIMNCSACDVCKEAIADCRGVPLLLSLIKEAVLRCSVSNPIPGSTPAPSASNSSAALGAGSSSRTISGSGSISSSGGAGGPAAGSSSSSAAQDLRTPGECKAAVFAAGALMNMGGVISVQEKLLAGGAVAILEATVRVAIPGDVVATRANFMLSWLAVATGALHPERERRGAGAAAAAAAAAAQLHHSHGPHRTSGAGSGSSSPRGTSRQQSTAQHSTTSSAPPSARSTSSGVAPGAGARGSAGGHNSGQHAGGQQQQHVSSRLGSPATGTAGRVMAGSPAVGLRSLPGTPDHKPGSAAASGKAPLTGHA